MSETTLFIVILVVGSVFIALLTQGMSVPELVVCVLVMLVLAASPYVVIPMGHWLYP